MTYIEHNFPTRIDRRTAVKWVLTAVASAKLLARSSLGSEPAGPKGRGYGTDPDLFRTYHPGELWPLTLTSAQRATAAHLCDIIIPADSHSPSASQLGVHDFIDEWISAPYPAHGKDRRVILFGLGWIEQQSQRRHNKALGDLTEEQSHRLCSDICFKQKAPAEYKAAAEFFDRYRDLTAGGFYTTPEGMKDIGYVGNVPTVTFAGPPPEVLKRLGVV